MKPCIPTLRHEPRPDFACAYCGKEIATLGEAVTHVCPSSKPPTFERCACGLPKGTCWRCAPMEE